MFPTLLELGPLTIHTYGLFIALGFVFGMSVAMREARIRGRNPAMVQDLGFYAIIGAVVGSRALFVLMNLDHFLNNPLEMVMFWKGGLVFLGGAILAVSLMVAYVLRKGDSVLTWADICVPGLALGQALGRIGCLAAGCCYGDACDLPWAITFTDPHSLAPLNVPLHPTQLYASLAGLLNLAVLLGFRSSFSTPGRIAGLYLLIYAPSRITIEFLRGDFRTDLGPFSTTQIIAMLLIVLGIWLMTRKAPASQTPNAHGGGSNVHPA